MSTVGMLSTVLLVQMQAGSTTLPVTILKLDDRSLLVAIGAARFGVHRIVDVLGRKLGHRLIIFICTVLAQVGRFRVITVIGIDSWMVIERSVVIRLFPVMRRGLQRCAAINVLVRPMPIELLLPLLLRLLLHLMVLLLLCAAARSTSLLARLVSFAVALAIGRASRVFLDRLCRGSGLDMPLPVVLSTIVLS